MAMRDVRGRATCLACIAAALALVAGSEPSTIERAEAAYQQAKAAGDPDAAVPHLQEAARLGHRVAQAAMGMAYAQGHGGIEPDAEQARHWFRAAASQGDEEAAYNLVALCEARPRCVDGDGQAAELKDVLSWLRVAAAGGLSEAGFQAGNMLLGSGDAPAARSAFAAEAGRGHAAATFNLAHLYATGAEGVAQDLAAAIRWFGRAREAARTQGNRKVEADAAAAASQASGLHVTALPPPYRRPVAAMPPPCAMTSPCHDRRAATHR